MDVLSVSCISLFPLCQSCGQPVHLGACRPRLLLCCLDRLQRCFSYTAYTNTRTHTLRCGRSAGVLSCLCLAFCFSLSVVLSATHMHWVSAPTCAVPLPSSGAPLSLSLFSHEFSTSSHSALASSCVIQLRNIRSSRLAINIACPPKTVRIIIFLIITAVFL